MDIRPSRTSTPSSPIAAQSLTVPADGFLSEVTVEHWVRAGVAVRGPGCLAMRDGRVFTLVEALRILGRRDGESDPYSLTGRVVSLRTLVRNGAVLSASGARLGAATYDVEFGAMVETWSTPHFP